VCYSTEIKKRKDEIMQRRDFLKCSAAASTFLILPSGTRAGANAPSNKLNIALIGVWGRANGHYRAISAENVVAICDVDEKHLDFAAKSFPKAQRYVDWRKCLERKDLDAVVCCTTDHTHAFISTWAMNRGLHVYSEKPLANSVEEARLVRSTYLKHKDKLATQVGTQRHAYSNFNRIREMIQDGAIGELKSAYAWGNRKLHRKGYPKGTGKPPKNLHYDLWIGPAPFHPYSPEYFKAHTPGQNCLQWNMYWDFGTGQVGDMGSHTMDLVWNAVDAGKPTSASGKGEAFNPDVTPVKLTMTFDHPANDWRPAIQVAWFQGGAMPNSPKPYLNLNRISHGAMFKGSNGFLVADFTSRMLLPYGKRADMTYYKPRSKDKLIPNMHGFQQEWLDACKGNLKTSCDFDYAGNMIEQMLLGLVAYRVGKKLDYDGKTGRVLNSPEANALLAHKYRKGWVLNG
jgi:predicted dehydrogenase